MTAGTTTRLFMLTAALGVCLTLGACGTFSGFVSDNWPTWAGGMPKDVPPRPGAPGYEEFMAHQQQHEPAPNAAAVPVAASGTTGAVTAAAAPSGKTAVAVPGAAPATTAAVPSAYAPPAGNANTQPPLPPAYARPDDRSATQGGLY